MFLDAIALARTLPCLADPGKIIVIGKPSRPLDDVIPFMATLPGVIAFNPDQCTLTLRRQPGFISLQGHEVCISQVRDLEEGLGLLAALTESINAFWERRAQLVGAEHPDIHQVPSIFGSSCRRRTAGSAENNHAWHSPQVCCNTNDW
jgi:ArsR family metal-binding transcriptional regulator